MIDWKWEYMEQVFGRLAETIDIFFARFDIERFQGKDVQDELEAVESLSNNWQQQKKQKIKKAKNKKQLATDSPVPHGATRTAAWPED